MTVKELIESLSIFDPNLPVTIEDADEGNLLNVNEIFDGGNFISIGGNYGDRFKE